MKHHYSVALIDRECGQTVWKASFIGWGQMYNSLAVLIKGIDKPVRLDIQITVEYGPMPEA